MAGTTTNTTTATTTTSRTGILKFKMQWKLIPVANVAPYRICNKRRKSYTKTEMFDETVIKKKLSFESPEKKDAESYENIDMDELARLQEMFNKARISDFSEKPKNS